MVKVKEATPWKVENGMQTEAFIQQLQERNYLHDLDMLRHACALGALNEHAHASETGLSCTQQGLTMADILADLEADRETLAAALIFESVHYSDITIEIVEEQLGSTVAKLIKGVERMGAIQNLSSMGKGPHHQHQIDNIRKMFLAMVDDVRVVLIKLAERLCVLRNSSHLPEATQIQIATEAMEIYAPLANRLGIGALKWEMEDLAFRYLHPQAYKAIAKGLNAKRLDRDRYVKLIEEELTRQLHAIGITHFRVYGRSKHIHSIYKKMQRKNVPLEEIYDATAFRVLLDTKEQCYDVLSLVHSIWLQIPVEFDDYISKPKSNGYQSLHTAVEGPEKRVFEVQIRTFNMHALAEMGVAAHWKYKEGGAQQKESHERKIEWLRDVLAWHKEMAKSSGIPDTVEREFLEDRVYVFTPEGDVLDLPHGVTPLDFAYHVHTGLGHRCRGAKANGSIVPLTYVLRTGDRVEILTGKELRPSRDWINPHLNYLKTSRAKAKVLHWFKMQDYDRNKIDGHEILEKEFKALGISNEGLSEVVSALNFKRLDDLFAAVGRGDIKLSQITNRLVPHEPQRDTIQTLIKPHKPEPVKGGGDLKVEGVGNLLTTMARCCQPVPGDKILGYITLGRGVTIHRVDCPNILHSSEKQRKRFLEVHWGTTTKDHYLVDLNINAYDRPGLLRDITTLLANEHAHVYSLQTNLNKKEHTICLSLTVEIDGLNSLSRLLSRLEQVPNVREARRQITGA